MNALLNLLLQAHALSGVAHSSKHLNTARKFGKGKAGRHVQSGGVNGMYPVNRGDLSLVPPDLTVVPQSVPSNVASLVAWDTVKYDVFLYTSTSATNENNFAFNLTNHPQYTSWQNIFDQYCIVQATVSFRSDLGPGQSVGPSLLYTAVDFDSSSSISGSIPAIEDFSSCEVHTMSAGSTALRSVRPCCKDVIALANAGSIGSLGPSRRWLDLTASPSVQHYGIRTILGPSVGATYQVIATVTMWIAFRNQI